MSTRRIGFDSAQLEPTVKEETDTHIVIPAIIAREMVQKYRDGVAYKPAEELEAAAADAEGRFVTVDTHPDTVLLGRRTDIKGRVRSPEFVKNLIEPKTQRPEDRGIRADIILEKRRLPAGWYDAFKRGEKRDVSIGFTYDTDPTPGEWRGQKYDYVQRNIFIDHVAVGVPLGRCPSPLCGLGVDSMLLEEDGDCPIAGEIRRLGVKESCKRLAAAYGSDALNALSDAAQTQREKDKAAQEARSKQYGIAVKEGGNVTKPSEYASIPDSEFGDPVNYAYPIDESHVMAAWAYWSKPANQSTYSSEEKGSVEKRIKAAMKKHGHQVADSADILRAADEAITRARGLLSRSLD